MRLIRVVLAALTLALAATACGADAAAPPSSSPSPRPAPAPHWTAVPATGISPDRLTDLQGGAGWDKGFVLAGSHTVPAAPNDRGQVNDLVADVYTSPDGGRWTDVTPDGLRQVGHQTPVAGYGKAVYVLGATASGAAVWRSGDGASWSKSLLPGSMPGEALTAVAAGPHGVVVVGFDRPISVLDNDFIDNSPLDGLRIWHSADGKTFTGPQTVDVPGLYNGYLPDVVATADGFTAFGVNKSSPDTLLLSSPDGTAWTAEEPGSLRGRAVSWARAGDLTVLVTDPATTDGDSRPAAWRRKTGDDDWTASHDITVGVLPDTNVAQPAEQRLRQVTAWRGWFLAAGSSGDGGGVWLSPDGARWERVPVKENGFEAAESLSVFVNDTTVLVAGSPASGGGAPKVWRA